MSLILSWNLQPSQCITMAATVWGWESMSSDIKALQRLMETNPRQRRAKRRRKKLHLLLLEEFTTPPTDSQQVRTDFKQNSSNWTWASDQLKLGVFTIPDWWNPVLSPFSQMTPLSWSQTSRGASAALQHSWCLCRSFSPWPPSY